MDAGTHKTRIFDSSASSLDRAAAILREGGLVAFPTETVYGLGGDATDARAVAAIYEAKNRPQFNPLIAHFPDMDSAAEHVGFTPLAERLAEHFWPGALTLVLKRNPASSICDLACAGLDTLAVRVPAHAVARDLLRRTGRPVVAPSANPSGRLSPTSASHVIDVLDGRINAVIDAGSCHIGVESTILAVTEDTVRILRPGGIPAEEIAEAAGLEIAAAGDSGIIEAPGMMSSHYAPDCALRLNATQPLQGEIFLGFGEADHGPYSLSKKGDLREAAANLFSLLREIERTGASTIAVAPIPEQGLGRAINDRLRRAAAPRERG